MKYANKIRQLFLKKRANLIKVAAASCFVGSALFSLYHIVYAQKVIPGVSMVGVDFSGKTQEEVRLLLKTRFKQDPKVLFKYEDLQFVVSARDVGAEYSVNENTKRLFRLGRTGNFYIDTKDKLAGLLKGLTINPLYKYDNDLLNSKVSEIEARIEVDYFEPSILISESGTLSVSKAQAGVSLNNEKLRTYVFSTFDSSSDKTFNLPTTKTIPKNNEQQVASLIPEVEKIISNSPVIKLEDKEWKYTKEDLLTLLSHENSGERAQIVINKENLINLTNQLANEVNVPATGELLRTEGDRVIEFKPRTDGRSMNKEDFKKSFSKALLSNDQNDKEVKLLVSESKAPESNNQYGIYALLGEGASYFVGSIPGRVKNLSLASEKASGMLIPPGGTYSFNRFVGEISARTGFDYAYIIQNGRTVLGEGGGVCQASTTIFRAALNAGLPITKRTAHAYRVGYYEQKSEPGLDATVFSPSVDFEFKNDTPGYLLVQHSIDLSKSELRFRIYGTPDGREVKIEKPVMLSQMPPGEAQYIDDSNYKKGQVVQVEHPTWGAVVSVKRTVTKGGNVLHDDTFISRYQPWRAVYLKGTR